MLVNKNWIPIIERAAWGRAGDGIPDWSKRYIYIFRRIGILLGDPYLEFAPSLTNIHRQSMLSHAGCGRSVPSDQHPDGSRTFSPSFFLFF